MPYSYTNTSLWKRTLGSHDGDVAPLRKSYEQARENISFLLGKIRDDFPFLTKHDISHVDSLWRVADTIIGEEYPINPLEGYFLGISFLIHDLALSFDSVGGKDRLQATEEWNDAFHGDRPKGMTEQEFKDECDFTAIRLRHAKEAETILERPFTFANGDSFHILGHDDFAELILNHFRESIGLIAASHHWSVNEIEERLDPELDPLELISPNWGVNQWKVACILRCADAGHIDNGRAPDRIYKELMLNGVPRNHWEAQNHLSIVTEDSNDPTKLRIKSTRRFPKEESNAWAVAYAAIRQFDQELKKSNALLKSMNLSFPHDGVSGATSKEALKEYVKTVTDGPQGWEPCDFSLHTSDTKALIENLGGAQLYGAKYPLLIVLRELIQNSRDAIQARSRRANRFTLEDGIITVKYTESEGKRTIKVEDNGIGMSLNCIKHHLLNFGSSYWKSYLVKEEYPGLISSGFSPIGKYGIGFYSVFMVAKSVTVRTRRFEDNTNAKVLEFGKGLTLSPILSNCILDMSISTVVEFELKDDVKVSFIGGINGNNSMHQMNLSKGIQMLVAGLDVDVYYKDSSGCSRIHTSPLSSGFDKTGWLRDLLIPGCPLERSLSDRLEKLMDDEGRILGLIAPPPFRSYIESDWPCLITVGGLVSKDLSGSWNYGGLPFVGYLDGSSNTISRDNPILDSSVVPHLRRWTVQKYREDYDMIASSRFLARDYHALIEMSEAEDEIVSSNEIAVYSDFRNRMDSALESIFCLKKLDTRLFAGVRGDAGQFYFLSWLRSHPLDGEGIDTTIELLPEEERLLTRQIKQENDQMRLLIQLLKMKMTDLESIIARYRTLIQMHLFSYHNHLTIKTWVNLTLDQEFEMMIDWKMVSSIVADECPTLDVLKTCLLPSSVFLESLKNC